MEGWQVRHREVILTVLNAVKLSKLKYILKGGTALMLSYNLPRFSEDIDLDEESGALDFFVIMEYVAACNAWEIRIAKDTHTVKRVFLHYGGDKPLKVEVSTREAYVPESFYQKDQEGFWVYNVQALTRFKCAAYSGRDRIRDAFDLCYLVSKYYDKMDEALRHSVSQALLGKGFDNIEYLMHNQPDELIDLNLLQDLYLEAWDRLHIAK